MLGRSWLCLFLSRVSSLGWGFMGYISPEPLEQDKAQEREDGLCVGSNCLLPWSLSPPLPVQILASSPALHPITLAHINFRLLKALRPGSSTFFALMFYHPLSPNQALSSARPGTPSSIPLGSPQSEIEMGGIGTKLGEEVKAGSTCATLLSC